MSEEVKILRSIEKKLDEICKWVKISSKWQIKPFLSQNIVKDLEATIYELSDGSRSTRDIAQIVNKISHVTVSRYWKKWANLGIVIPSDSYQGRFQKIFSLEEVGLSLPPILKNVDVDEDAM